LLQPIHAVVDIVVDFADKFVRLEAENAQLREAAKSSSDQVREANRLATETRNENASLKEELKKLKKKMKEEEESKLKAYAEADKKEGAIRKSIESLLGKTSLPHLFLIYLLYLIVVMN
jgi:predicted  nucleic acid-binding Zn-ribbon protein